MAGTRRRGRRTRGGGSRRYWSAEATRRSDALDLEPRVFLRSARAIAASLKRSAERSRRRKATAYASAMSMLNFYINRAGRGLSASRRATLERAKRELRRLYGRAPRARPAPRASTRRPAAGRRRRP